jgi:hypothetical protein
VAWDSFGAADILVNNAFKPFAFRAPNLDGIDKIAG